MMSKKPNYGIDSIEMISLPLQNGVSIEGYAIYFPLKLKSLLDEKKKEKFHYAPIQSLHDTIKVFFSDFLFFNTRAEWKTNEPWLFFNETFDIEWLKLIIQSWYHVQFNQSLSDEFLDELSFKEEVREIDITISESGNPHIKDHFVYQYYPKYCISKLSKEFFIPSLGKSLTFVPIQTDGKAEMVSWPPEKVSTKKHTDYFSYKVTLQLQTIPFKKEPLIYIHVGLIRWVSSDNIVTREKGLTVYIRGKWPWVVGRENNLPFISAKIKKQKDFTYQWENHLDKIIEGVNAASQISPLKYLNEDTGMIFEETNQLQTFSVSVPYSAHIYGNHRIKSGAGLIESYDIATAIADQLSIAKGFDRLPKVSNASTVSTKSIEYTFPKQLEIYLYYSDIHWLEEAINSICETLHIERCASNEYEFNGSRIKLKPMEITENLADLKKVEEAVQIIGKLIPNNTSLVGCLFELANKENFKRSLDPKNIIRNVFARNQVLTQFITPMKPNEDASNRFKKGTLDLYRQIGILSYRAMGLMQENTAYVGLYSIKGNNKTGRRNVEFPIMVKVSNQGVEMCIPTVGWVPYSEGQLLLAQHSDKYTNNFNKSDVSQFLYANLEMLSEKHIILFTHGQNSRSMIKTLNNISIQKDKFDIKHDKLSVVRIRDQENGEAFDWCSYSTTDGEYPKGSYPHSLITGLFELNDRVFISIANKPGTASGMIPTKTKIEAPTQLFRRETAVEVTVAVCKEGITPLQLAKVTHDLRKKTSIQYEQDMTILPLPLHLAMKAKEYAVKI